MTEKYINPFTDFGFKKLFGEEVNKDLLIDFLNHLIQEKEQIVSLTYLRNEHLGAALTDRKAIFDLYCENHKGEKFIVELQKARQKFFKDRSVFYTTFPIQEQAQQGDWNFELKSVYTIAILDFTFNEQEAYQDTFRYDVQLVDTNKGSVFYDKLKFIYLEMPKFNKQEGDLETSYDKWLYVLKNLPKLQDRPKALQDRVFTRLFEAAEIARFDSQERQDYQDSLKYYRDFKNVMDTAREESFEEGKRSEKFSLAKTMKQAGEPIEKIIQYTGLSVQEIETL
ncbi:MAG: Rpn family recombination-promoting nuclease/putative transposase [Cyclobacteriaceae bacterium]|jgi:predicted transposase/invertase (TIGR01784 family)